MWVNYKLSQLKNSFFESLDELEFMRLRVAPVA
jgi:hypothetical protein